MLLSMSMCMYMCVQPRVVLCVPCLKDRKWVVVCRRNDGNFYEKCPNHLPSYVIVTSSSEDLPKILVSLCLLYESFFFTLYTFY